MTNRNLYAYTEPGTAPGYINASKQDDGKIILTVRGSGTEDGSTGPTVSRVLTQGQARELAKAILHAL